MVAINPALVFFSREERMAHKQSKLIWNVVGRVKNAIRAAAENAGRQMGSEVTINTEEALFERGYDLHVMSHASQQTRDFMIRISSNRQILGQAFLSVHRDDETLLDLCEVTHDAQQRQAIERILELLGKMI